MAQNQEYNERRVLSLPTTGLIAGDRYYLSVGNNKYQTHIVSDSLQLTKESGAEFIEVDTMAQMRALDSRQIWALQNGHYKGVKLSGYYAKGDTPSPIEYYLSSTTELDDGGSVFEVGGVKLVHDFGDNKTSVKYFGVRDSNTGVENTTRINKCLSICRNVIIDEGLNLELDELITYTELTTDLRNVIVIPSYTNLEINGKLKFINNESLYHAVLSINDVSNVKVYGNGSIEGTYLTSPNISSGSGHGVSMYDCEYVDVSGLKVFHFQGDGFYILGRRRDQSDLLCRYININNNNIFGNSRQGISIIKGAHININNNVISHTGVLNGSVIGCGIDMEPEWHRTIENINIINNDFVDNYSNHINMLILVTTTAIIRNINIQNNNLKQGGLGTTCYGINARKGSPETDGLIEGINVVDNRISLDNVRAQRGISFSNRVDNCNIQRNVITKNYSDLPSDPTSSSFFRGISLASTKDITINDNKIYGNFRYGVYGESSYTNNVSLKDNLISGSVTHLNARQLTLLSLDNNKFIGGNEGINVASITNLKIRGNYIGDFNSFGIGGSTNIINAEISNNTLEDCCKLTGGNSSETEINRTWLGVFSTVAASPSKYVDIENNFFMRSEGVVLYRHISNNNNQTRYLNIRGNISREEDLVVFNNSVTGDIKSPHRTFGVTAQKPPTLPTFSSGYYFDTTTSKWSAWNGSAWVEINGNATNSVKGVVNQSANVAGITLADLSAILTPDASDEATAISLVNAIKGYVNTNVVPLVNNLKLTQNQSLNTDKASGQRSSL